jgi:hypothetical protein
MIPPNGRIISYSFRGKKTVFTDALYNNYNSYNSYEATMGKFTAIVYIICACNEYSGDTHIKMKTVKQLSE